VQLKLFVKDKDEKSFYGEREKETAAENFEV